MFRGRSPFWGAHLTPLHICSVFFFVCLFLFACIITLLLHLDFDGLFLFLTPLILFDLSVKAWGQVEGREGVRLLRSIIAKMWSKVNSWKRGGLFGPIRLWVRLCVGERDGGGRTLSTTKISIFLLITNTETGVVVRCFYISLLHTIPLPTFNDSLIPREGLGAGCLVCYDTLVRLV